MQYNQNWSYYYVINLLCSFESKQSSHSTQKMKLPEISVILTYCFFTTISERSSEWDVGNTILL